MDFFDGRFGLDFFGAKAFAFLFGHEKLLILEIFE